MFPLYNNWWSGLQVVKQKEANEAASRIRAGKDRYQAVSELTTVPWYVIGLLHMRESNNNFHCWLHNGDPMVRDGFPSRTVQVPAGRPPNPYVSWEEGAVDALQGFKLTTIKDWTAERIAYVSEAFNGWGYTLYHHVPSPYLFGGSSVQLRGKYVADGKWDGTTWDGQLGVLTTLKALIQMDPSIVLHPSVTVSSPVLPAPIPTPKAGPSSLPTMKPTFVQKIITLIVSFVTSLFKKK